MEEIILKEREIKEQIVQIINNSGLPAIILRPIFKDFLEQINLQEQRQYEESIKLVEEKKKKKEGK